MQIAEFLYLPNSKCPVQTTWNWSLIRALSVCICLVLFMAWLALSTQGQIFSRQHIDFFFLFFPENGIWHFMQIGDNLHEMSNPVFLANKKKITYLLSAELAQRVAWYNVNRPCNSYGFQRSFTISQREWGCVSKCQFLPAYLPQKWVWFSPIGSKIYLAIWGFWKSTEYNRIQYNRKNRIQLKLNAYAVFQVKL